MIIQMAKGTRLNLRISEAFRDDIERLAEYHGLSLSSYAHSLLVKAIRRERESTPEAFQFPTVRSPHLAPVVATITPAVDPKDEVRRMIGTGEIDEIERRLAPRGRPLAPRSNKGIPTQTEVTTTEAKRRRTK